MNAFLYPCRVTGSVETNVTETVETNTETNCSVTLLEKLWHISWKPLGQCDVKPQQTHKRLCSDWRSPKEEEGTGSRAEALRLLASVQNQVHVRSGHQALLRDAELLHQTFSYLKSKRRSVTWAGELHAKWKRADADGCSSFFLIYGRLWTIWTGLRWIIWSGTGRASGVFTTDRLTCCPSSTLCSGLITTWTQIRVSSASTSSPRIHAGLTCGAELTDRHSRSGGYGYGGETWSCGVPTGSVYV